jgi:zinc transport system permease protein
LTLTTSDLYAIIIAAVVVVALVWALWYPLLGATLTPRYLIPFRRTPQLVSLLYFWILAVVVWIGIKTIGGLLIGALLVIPVLTVRGIARSFKAVVLYSTGVAVAAVLVGLVIALYVDLPPSSLIIGTLIFLFALQALLRPNNH